MDKKLIVFVCTGNVCRSPLGEYMFRPYLVAYPKWRTCSAGVMAGVGAPPSRFSVEAANEIGIDVGAHRSQPVTRDLIDAASLIIVMTATHRDALCERFPEAAPKVRRLKSFDPESSTDDVMDPIGLSLDVYRHVRNEIAAALPGLEAHVARLDAGEDV